jgi:hypothetical protein
VKRVRGILLVLVGALLLSGCTLISTSNAPSVVPKGKVGFSLNKPTIPGTDNARVRFDTLPIYFIDATGHLTPSSRLVASPLTLSSVIDELLVGPTKIERFAGYSTDVPKNFVLVSATLKGKLGIVDVATPLTVLSHENQILALGQLVLTAYDAGVTEGIEITVAGTPALSLLPNGTRQLVATRADFVSLLNG